MKIDILPIDIRMKLGQIFAKYCRVFPNHPIESHRYEVFVLGYVARGCDAESCLRDWIEGLDDDVIRQIRDNELAAGDIAKTCFHYVSVAASPSRRKDAGRGKGLLACEVGGEVTFTEVDEE